MNAGFGVARLARHRMAAAIVIGVGLGAVVTNTSAATFSARETHGGLVVDRADGRTDRLVSNGWFLQSGQPTFVYRDGGGRVAGVWDTGAETAVVRAGTTANAAAIGRIVPTWDDNAFRLAIEPAGGPEIRTTVFERESGSGTLNRGASTREALEGSYRATLRSTGGDVVGWLRVDVDPEGGTRFAGDLPSTVSPALAAAAAAAIDGEVSFIYADLDDVNPLCH